MGDRICVMKDGVIQQVAAPLELYNRPQNLFVAGFIGSPPMNFFAGVLSRVGSEIWFSEKNEKSPPVELKLPGSISKKIAARLDQPVFFGIRPENIHDVPATTDGNPVSTTEVRVEVSEPMGAETLLYLTTGATSFIARVRPTDRFEANQRINVTFDLAHAHFFDVASEQVL